MSLLARQFDGLGKCVALTLLALLAVTSSAGRTWGEEPSGIEFFERKIRPLLANRCYECHARTAKRPEGGLLLDTSAGIRAGGENGPLVSTDKPDDSLLLEVVRYHGDIQMPPDGKLPAAEIALLETWVERGAPLPDDGTVAPGAQRIDFAKGRQFWSFQPLRDVHPPAIADAPTSIDAFLQAKLTQHDLRPAPPADRATLIRRAMFDLLGLPPTPEEVEAFIHDSSPDAYERLIDRLLASPHYGERWGRHWLDLARYADGNKTSLETRDQAWVYRDWVVRSLNDDLPYDEFIRRQLAADKLDLPPQERAALGFLALSPEYFKELKLSPEIIRAIVADEWEERIDAVGRTFLGLSLACARCHDHKFDPVSTEDYYALAGVFASTRVLERSILPEAEAAVVEQARAEIRQLAHAIKQLKEAKPPPDDAAAQIAQHEQRIAEIERTTPHYHAATAHAVDDAALYVEADGPAHTKLVYKQGEAQNLALQIRGNPGKLGPVVPRRFLTVFADESSPSLFTVGSGRRELAEAIVGPAAPLTARVIVNRVWAHHFGRGLVETVSDFGTQGERPSHPELLDYLVRRFIDDGWSLKRLHRTIMLSAAYQQASICDNPAALAVDPDNRLLWRMNRRRLDVEAWRDALLAASGNLDLRIGGPSGELDSADHVRRTLYGRIERSDTDVVLRLFDFPDPSAHAPSRVPTTTALQQLFVLNGPLMTRQSSELARRLIADDSPTPETIVRRAYRQLFARAPSDAELRLGMEYLTAEAASPAPETVRRYAQALLASNEFLFVD